MKFLSIQAQDFIEEALRVLLRLEKSVFLSIQAQDFIEEHPHNILDAVREFLSIQAQDFIEEIKHAFRT